MSARSTLFASMLLALVPVVLQADEPPAKLRLCTWNLEWFYDDYTGDNPSKLAREQSAPSREEWNWKLETTAAAIAKIDPDILCLQEIESRRTLYTLAKTLKEKHSLEYRIAFIEGNDVFTEQDVGILSKSGLVSFSRREQSKEMWQSKDFYDLQKHIFAEFEWGSGPTLQRLTLLNVHLRAMPDQEDVRRRQGRLCHHWLKDRITAGENVVLLGDLNSDHPCEEHAADTDIGTIRGLHSETTQDDLFDCHELIPSEARATHIIHKQFDRVLVSPALRLDQPDKPNYVLTGAAVRKDLNTRGQEQDKDHWNIYYKIPAEERDISDHFPLVAEFELK
jgi:endonuclease/exonuclease/phosphatase family metal-dependent hydrolase